MRAIVMAGGRGRRLEPYTSVIPKPLMPLGERPIIDVIVRQLIAAGIEQVTLAVGHLGGIIESWIRQEGGYGVPVDFAYEDAPLGTAGALGRVSPGGQTFLALNGDILTTVSFESLLAFHREAGVIATVAANERVVDVEYGVLYAEDDGTLLRLEEKPQIRYTVSMGVYAFEPAILDYIEPGERVDFPELLERVMGRGQRVAAYRHDGYWRDIGNRSDYEDAIVDFQQDPGRFLPGSNAGR